MSQYFIEDNNLKENLKLNKVSVKDISLSFYTDSGLFNKKGLDLGTRILLENFDISNKTSYLDLGCGCGPVGIFLGLKTKDSIIDMIDINSRAIEITKKSLQLNNLNNINAFKNDGLKNIDKKYDCILLNPPIHAGKNKIYELITDSYSHLNEKGELWIVIRKNHGANSLKSDFSKLFDIELVKKDHGFWIMKFKNRI